MAEAVASDHYHVMWGREPSTSFTALIEGHDYSFPFSPIDEDSWQQLVVFLVNTQEDLLAGVLQCVDSDLCHHRVRGGRSNTLPHFTMGDYVRGARVSRQGKHRKFMSTWTTLWRVANDDKEDVYTVQHLVIAELHDVRVARIRFYADDQLDITGELKVFQHLGNRGEYNIRSISTIEWAASDDEFVVKVAWEGLEEAESTREPPSWAFHDAPDAWGKDLKALRLTARF